MNELKFIHLNPNAFAHTFAFAQRTNPVSKSKRECKPTHHDKANEWTTFLQTRRANR